MSDDWIDDPFADPGDPEAAARERRRREREEKRQKREAKKAAKDAARGGPGDGSPEQQRGGSIEPSPGPPDPPPGSAEIPLPPRTPDQDFWDEPADEPGSAAVEEPAGAADAQRAWSEPREPAPRTAEQALPPAPAPRYADEGLPPEQTPDARGPGRVGRDGAGAGILGSLRRHPLRIVAALVALAVVWFLWSLFQPFHGDGSGKVAVRIPKGAGVSEVGDILERKGVIDSSFFFQARVTLEGSRSDLYPGHYTLAHGISYGSAIEALTSKPPVKQTLTVTIPEGYSRSQAAQLVEEDGIDGSYTKATVRSKYLNPASYGGKGAKDLEGFLFPDTFEMKPNAPVADLVQLQLQDFKKKIKSVDMSYAKSKNLTVYDILIIASMIEREAGISSQRKQVAAVVYNRLHEGMPLGIDATIRFATGNYTQPLTESELAVDSPYNTRTNQGLPPGPINSPGLEAIEAAAHPSKDDYLFYVNKPNTCGELAFSKNESEFEADVAAYEKAREANGGNEPTTCGE